MCGGEKWTRPKEDISRKTAAHIRFLKSTVGRTRRDTEYETKRSGTTLQDKRTNTTRKNLLCSRFKNE
jgi:hypothetical protein